MSYTAPDHCADNIRKPVIYAALELSGKTWLIAVHSPVADKISLHSLAAGQVSELLALFTRARERAQAQSGTAIEVVCCYEAGYDGFWLHRLLCAHGIDNRVLDAASILVDRRARRAKTDRLDAAALLRTLMALERGEPRVCRVVRVPSPEHEDERRRSRERARLVNERGQHTNRIKGLLMSQGIRDFAPTRRDWRERLEDLRTADGRELPPCLKAEIVREGRRLELVIEMIAEVEAGQHQAAAARPAVLPLRRLRGVGPAIANVLQDEVFFRTFRNRREVAGYLGLTASPWCSGTLQRDQGIAKAGNPRARRMAIELAWLWVRHQPGSALALWFQARVGAAKGRLRRIMLVALARKLMIALWRYVTAGVIPEGAALTA